MAHEAPQTEIAALIAVARKDLIKADTDYTAGFLMGYIHGLLTLRAIEGEQEA